MTRYSLLLLTFFFHFAVNCQQQFYRLLDRGELELLRGNAPAARYNLEKARTLLPKNLPAEDKALFFNNMGVAYYQCGDYEKGIQQYRFSLNYCRQSGADSLVAKALLNLGLAYKEIGAFEQAVRELLQSARIAERIGSSKDLAATWNAIGNIEKDLKNFHKALYYHRRALRLREEISYEKGIADSYHNIGNLYLDWKQYDKAETNLLVALRRKRQLTNQSNLFNTLAMLGKLYVARNEPEKAYVWLTEAYVRTLSAENLDKSTENLYYLATYFHSNGELLKALALYRQVGDLARSASNWQLLADALQGEISINEQQSSSSELVGKYRELLKVKKQAAEDANHKEIARLEINYDVERKNTELSHRARQNKHLFIGIIVATLFVILLIVNAYRLRKSKRQIRTLHDELSHRTKNYFTMLSGILRIEKQHTRNEQVIAVLDTNIQRLESMALVQKYLLDDSTRHNNYVQMDTYLGNLTNNLLLNLFPQSIQLQVDQHFDPFYLHYNKAMHLALVLNELICNTIEHGLTGVTEPRLVVSLKHQGQQLIMLVHDNGPGIPIGLPKTRLTKGQVLITDHLKMIGGTIVYRNENGCVAKVIVPL